MDTISLVDEYPGEDERVIAKAITRAGGGPAAVAAVALSRLGIHTAIVGTVGDDADGKVVLDIFSQEGVDTSGISIGNNATSGSVIVASQTNHARAISTRQPVNQEPLNIAARNLINKAQWVHVDHVGIHQLSDAEIWRGIDAQISFDAGYGVEKFDASTVDLFVPTSHQMLLRYPGLNIELAIEQDAKEAENIVVATMGAKGSVGYSIQTGLVKARAFNVDVVSTLGAGDVFHGALVAQLVLGLGLQEALHRANAVAALSCRGLDGQSMIPTTSELNAYLEAQL